MKLLTVSDRVDELIYSPAILDRFKNVDLILAAGDLPHYYLEYIVTMLGGPLYYVEGNHANKVTHTQRPQSPWGYPGGCENIHGRAVRYKRLLIAGLEGSMRYNSRPHYQYTEREMAWEVWRLAPSLVWNRLRYGRYLDILLTHAPAKGIHDRSDRCHQGFQAFLTLMDRFPPRYLIHGHVHLYSSLEPYETNYRSTRVINTYGHRTITIDAESLR
jgi:Icc-related predicted phosphoesterase